MKRYIYICLIGVAITTPSFAYKTLDDLVPMYAEPWYAEPCSISNDGKMSSDGGCLKETFVSLKNGMWGAPFLDGKEQLDIVGHSICSKYYKDEKQFTAANDQTAVTKAGDGQYCYCQMAAPETSAWISGDNFKNYEDCNYYCADACGWYLVKESEMRKNMFATANSGGSDVNAEYLYTLTGTGVYAYINPGGTPDGNSDLAKDADLKKSGQWAALMVDKDDKEVIVTGTAWVVDSLDGVDGNLGDIPTNQSYITTNYDENYSGGNRKGKYCLCRLDRPAESSWTVFNGGMEFYDCTQMCGEVMSLYNTENLSEEYTRAVNSMLSTAKSSSTDTGEPDPTPTSVHYVIGQLEQKHPAFAGNGNDVLITAAGNDGRDIKNALGTSMTDVNVPTRGAVAYDMNKKQNLITGTANWATTFATNDGFSSKPVYDATTIYSDSLVDAATLNTAVIDAVNNELTLVDENGNPDSDGLLWRISDTFTLMPISVPSGLVNTNGTGYYYRKLSDGITSKVGDIGSSAGPENYGDWGVMFNYNGSPLEVKGISACSSLSGTYPQPASNQSTVENDYVTSGSGANANTNPPGYYCYCKMTSPAVSRWVFRYSYSSSSDCAASCAPNCGLYVRDYSGFRSGLFGSVQ